MRKVFVPLLAVVLTIGCQGGSPTPVVLSLRAVLVSTDLAKGADRLVFALLDSSSAPVQASAAWVELSSRQDGALVSRGRQKAVFRPWPVGTRGVFTLQADFPTPGEWVAEISPVDGDAAGQVARLVLRVQERSSTPPLGSAAPRSRNRTAKEVASLEELTTDAQPDPDLYGTTIAQALDAAKPLVVTFATPAFCQSATCGPQVDVVKALKKAYGGRANFVHVELYDNPQEMRQDLKKARLSPVVEEWGLPSDPWTFVMDAQGRVAAKFEAFTTYQELEEALRQVLSG
ncbi:MAG: hypothetical protein HY535_00095 [Chloroflexi bacterium]|nr:hypothetical protein [Chloroflexota bacterium]